MIRNRPVRRLHSNIREARRRLRMKQETLAEMVGVAQSIVCRYETGEIIPPQDKVEKLAEALSLTEAELRGL